jgi:hypothetical protein
VASERVTDMKDAVLEQLGHSTDCWEEIKDFLVLAMILFSVGISFVMFVLFLATFPYILEWIIR